MGKIRNWATVDKINYSKRIDDITLEDV
jgi:hypothetical protein